MKRTMISASVAVLAAACVQADITPTAAQDEMNATVTPLPTPPIAKRLPKTIEQVGRTRIDPYAWLKDDNWQAVMQDPSLLDADIRSYLEAENAYTAARLEAPNAVLQETLFAEMKGRIKEDDASTPAIDGPYAYYTRYREGGEYPILARKAAADAFDESAAETILLDGDALGDGKDYFAFGEVRHSPDHARIAYTIDTKGSEFYTLKVRDIASGEELDLEIPDTYGDFAWSADSNAVYWVKRNENNRPEAVYYRPLDASEDALVYREEDPGFFLNLSTSQSGRFIVIATNDHTTSERHVIPTDAEDPLSYTTIAQRTRNVEYDIVDFDGRFYILTNADGAVDFKIVSAPYDAPGRENWTDIVPHEPGKLRLGLLAFKDHLVRVERQDGLPELVVRARGGEEHKIAFDEAAYDLNARAGYEFETPTLRFTYASPATPDQTFDYDMSTRDRILRKTRDVPSGHNAADYVVERIMAPTRDGETAPVTLLRRADTPIDGSAPLLLYGYGSYGVTIPADFRTARLSLVDRGFIYAIAHIRGSKAKGYNWYLDGKLEKKQNTFNDFIDAGRHLAEIGYGAPGRVVAMGGSAGGLLMGAAVNMDPELFAGVIAAVPFVDVVNTMSDTELPLTPPEWPEWGNPLESAEDYDTILAYSPYDQVDDTPYPPMLITGGVTDPRVTYWEPAKWAAKLRHDAPDAGPYFLRINMDAGHGGASGRFEGLRETAVEYAFALSAVGLDDGASSWRKGATASVD